MTIENGAASAATNDPALADDEADAGRETPDEVEVTYNGKSYSLPPELRDALLRQADYTRKTQELAGQRRAFEAEREGHRREAATTRAHLKDAARIVALNDHLMQLDRIDWPRLQAQDPARAAQAWQQRLQMKDLRDRAARAWIEKDRANATQAQRATARRAGEAHAHLSRLIADWSPGLDAKLARYGTEQGLSQSEITGAALQNPNFVRLLHKAHQFDEAAKRDKAKQTFDVAQSARPVTCVGGGGGTASRRTTDASGDTLSTEEWAKRERERMRRR
ncbi:MAG TPA: hypothetical protein VHC39_16405 [Rhizomicrobium sp.]|nr:hypothetical protein [Rhizomicrobium sp.]